MSSPGDFIGLSFELDEAARHVMAAALLYIDLDLFNAESDAERKKKKGAVIDRKRSTFQLAHEDAQFWMKSGAELIAYISTATSDWPQEKRNFVLVETCFTPPFYPYELNFAEKDHTRSLSALAAALGLGTDEPERVMKSMKSAESAHRHINYWKVAGMVTAGALVGYFAAPVVGAWIGAAAGLNGAAAVAHGLAILGGGSLAAGGAGMFGGVVMVAGAGAVGAGGGMYLVELGHARAIGELIRLQVTFRHVISASQLREGKMIAIIDKLRMQEKELCKNLEAERAMNEKNANRIKEIERVIEAYNDSIAWFKKQESERKERETQQAHAA